MNNNTQKLVSVFSQDELSAMMTAVAGYVNTKRKQGRSTGVEVQAFNKIVDIRFSLFISGLFRMFTM